MAPKARQELVIPYTHFPAKPRSEAASGMISQSLPMAAMFMRNKLLSWTAVFLAVQAFMNEPINSPKESEGQPPILRVIFGIVSLLTCYMDLVFPNTASNVKRDIASDVASTVASTVSAATSS